MHHATCALFKQRKEDCIHSLCYRMNTILSLTELMTLVGLNCRGLHLLQDHEILAGCCCFAVAARHVVDQCLRKLAGLPFCVHVLDVPEFVGVAFDVGSGWSIPINRKDRHTAILLRRAASILVGIAANESMQTGKLI